MAQLSLYMDSADGAVQTFPVYELDYAKMREDIPGSFDTGTDMIQNPVTVRGVVCHKFLVSDNTINAYLPDDIPMQTARYGMPSGVDGSILPVNLNIADHDIFDAAGYGMTHVSGTATPSDFSDSVHYLTVATNDWSNTPDGNFRPYAAYRITEGFAPDATSGTRQFLNYRDENGVMSKRLFTATGAHFYIGKLGMYGDFAGTYRVVNPNTAILGARPYFFQSWASHYESEKKMYGICNADDEPIADYMNDPTRGYFVYPGGIEVRAGEYPYSSRVSWSNINMYPFFVHYTANGEDMYGIAYAQYTRVYAGTDYPYKLIVYGLGRDFWGASVISDGGSWGEDTQPAGGSGLWTFPSDDRGDTAGATVAAIATARRTALQAFYTASHGYQIHQILPNEIQNIFGLLYDDSFFARYTQSMFNPLSAVISLHLLPAVLCNPTANVTPLTLSGYDVSANLPTPQNFPLVDCMHAAHIGSLEIDATDTFIDYAPYTHAYLHLPYVGVLDIDINAIAAGSISIDYLTDAMTGNCAAYVTCIDRDGHTAIKYCATGNCAYSLPMFSAAQDGAAVGKIVSSTIGLAMSAITGNASTALSAVGGIAGGLFDAATSQRNTQITGTIGGNPGMISDTQCYLEIVRPVWANPQHYQQLAGLPSLLSGTISAYSQQGTPYTGYIRVISLETDGIQATDDEITQIEQILKSGIYVNAK